MKVAVVGYGTAGQATALLLTRDGHAVDVFERAPVLGPVGAGFLLQPTGLSVLWEMGLLGQALALGARIERLYGQTRQGRPVMDMRYRDLPSGGDAVLFGLGMQRGALFGLLDAAWQAGRSIHCGRRIIGIDADAGLVEAEDGERHGPYDLVVVADGAASTLRHQVGAPALDRPYPWGAQWCLVEQGPWPWPGELRQHYVRARRMVGMLPVGHRADDPTPRMSFFWSLPASDLATAGSDPVRWREDVAAVWPEAAGALCQVEVPSGLARARYRDTVLRRWHRGRVVVVGDAAHAMSPQLGQGVNMALMDARALRDALRLHAGLDRALDAYARERRAHVGIYHFWSRWLTPLFQSGLDGVSLLRDWTFHPLSRLPGGRGQMLRVLTGTRRGWLGRLALDPEFLDVLATSRTDSAPRR